MNYQFIVATAQNFIFLLKIRPQNIPEFLQRSKILLAIMIMT